MHTEWSPSDVKYSHFPYEYLKGVSKKVMQTHTSLGLKNTFIPSPPLQYPYIERKMSSISALGHVRPSLPKAILSKTEITGSVPQQREPLCWGLGWKLDATAAPSRSHVYSFFKSQVLIFHFQEGSATAMTLFYFHFLFFFSLNL